MIAIWALFPSCPSQVGTYMGHLAGTPDAPLPTLFKPFKFPNGLELKNRIVVAPMCQYSAESGTGMPSDYHLVHLGAFAMRGPALVITEATAVLHNGMISPEDLGIWDDGHISPFRRITEYIHSAGALAGIQLAHAGRKASELHPGCMHYQSVWPRVRTYPLSHHYRHIRTLGAGFERYLCTRGRTWLEERMGTKCYSLCRRLCYSSGDVLRGH
jgi:hypothetical protein